MSKKLLFLLLSTATLLSFAGINFYSIKKQQEGPLNFPAGKMYKKEWQRVDSLSDKGLTRSALDVIESIMAMAKQENNHAQIAKALIHKIKFESFIEEDSYIKAIHDLSKECDSAVFPLKNVLHSLLAEIYWGYYRSNRWRFLNRTETINFKSDDLRTWDLKKILQETIEHYEISLENTDSLKRTTLDLFDAVIIREKQVLSNGVVGEDTRQFRPALYDFLAHRAIDFFMHDEAELTKPAYQFELDRAVYFSDAPTFSKLKIETKDTFSLKFRAIRILQDLLRAHLTGSETTAFIDADLKRLKFLKSNSPDAIFVYNADSVQHDRDSIFLLALQNLEKKNSDHPSSAEINYEIANFYYEKGKQPAVSLPESDAKALLKAAEICSAVIQKFPNSYGAVNCKHLLSRMEEKSLAFTVENINVPNQPFRALVKYKNVKKVFLRLAKFDFNEYKNLTYKKYGKNLVDVLKTFKSVSEWSLGMPVDNDFRQHSTEIKIPALPPGHYVLFAGTSEKFDYTENGIAYSNFWVSNMSYVSRNNSKNGSYDVRVFHRETGVPLQGVSAELFYKKYNYVTRDYEEQPVGTFLTDENGYFNVPPNDEYRNFFMDFKYHEDRLNTDSYFYQYKPHHEEKKRIVTHFFTDRAIYRPGQTVYFKGIIVEMDDTPHRSEGKTGEPVLKTDFTTTVIFNDVNHQKVSELTLTANKYGSISGTFTAPTTGLTGQMHITDKYGSVYFSVEEYKRPKFEITFEKLKGSYKLGEKIIVKGNGRTYSGVAIGGAEVKYRVTRNANFPYRLGYRQSGYIPSSPQMEITNGITNTNDNGEFEITFTAIADKKIAQKMQPVFTYSVSADVTDIAGETRSGAQTVRVGYAALLINISIPEELNKNNKDSISLHTTNLAGEDEPAQGSISVWKLKNPEKTLRKRLWELPDKFIMNSSGFQSEFPKDVYADENNFVNWEKSSAAVFSESFNTGKSTRITLNNLSSWEPGIYTLEAKSKDRYGAEVKEIKYFTVFSENEKIVPANKIDWFVALKDKGEPNEKAAFLIGTKENNVNVLYEIEHNGEIAKQEFILLNNEQKKIEIPMEEKHRGNFAVHFLFVKNSRVYTYTQTIVVPHTDKMLDIEFETFRNKLLPGAKEEWRVKISPKFQVPSSKSKEKFAAEMLASMYDASLDVFRPHNWHFNILKSYSASVRWQTSYAFSVYNSQAYFEQWNKYPQFLTRYYDKLNWFGFSFYGSYMTERAEFSSSGGRKRDAKHNMPMQAMKQSEGEVQTAIAGAAMEDSTGADVTLYGEDGKDKSTQERSELSSVKARSNFNETAFFYPHLLTNEKGEIIISFTMPEALTRWKFNALAHTQDIKFGQISKEVITQKELMVTPNAPRFFREGDTIVFSAKVSNLSENDLNGEAQLILYDATTMKEITSDVLQGNNKALFAAKKLQSAPVSWKIKIPLGKSAIAYKVVAKAGNFSDGEEAALPVLTNRMLVTESLPLSLKNKQKKDFRFEKLINSGGSSTMTHHKLTLEFTANPAWYAIQALPYMMEYPYDCSEQIFNHFYATGIASYIANSSPKIKAVFEAWKMLSPDALLSNLEKNKELKSLMLEETPWVLDAKDETERKKRMALLFDLNTMSNDVGTALKKLEANQTPNGGWGWFAGMSDSRYITQYIVCGFGHLEKLCNTDFQSATNTEYSKIRSMLQKAVPYLDDRIREDYEWLKNQKTDMSKNHLGNYAIQYLYARTYFMNRIEISSRNKEAFNYYKGQAQKYWLENSRYMQGMVALALFRTGDKKTANDIIKSLKENAIFNDELGMYWKENSGGWYWYQAPIEAQALLIEAFNEIANDKISVNEMRVWLLKNKQTNNWETTKATAEACYALLLNGADWLKTESDIEITVGSQQIHPYDVPANSFATESLEAGTGYFKTSWSGNEIKPEWGKVTINKKDDGVSWGALYWQYFEQLDKITPHETPLKLNRKLFVEKSSDTGPVIVPIGSADLQPEHGNADNKSANYKSAVQVGDKIKVRIELRVDRDMEYVHLKDMRASGFEPVNVLSQYKWQDGLGYYESTRDAATNFFFDYLPKGTYVFEYPLRATHEGDFSNGITTIQCMYAPEFASHSEGVRVKIGKK